MNDLNIDDFCKDTAKIWHMLYLTFPQRNTLYVEDIIGPDSPDEFGLPSVRHLSTFHTLLWLAETDYLQFSQTVKQNAIEEARLSHRGFLLLSSQCTAADNHGAEKTRIEQLRHTQKTKSSDQLKKLVIQFMQCSRQYG